MAIRPSGSYVTKSRSGKKSNKNRQKEDKFAKKAYFNLTTQPIFPVTFHGRTLTQKLRVKEDLHKALRGRTFNVNQGDLTNENKDTFRNFCFKVGDVRGNDCLSFFNGMYVAREKISSMVRKWHTLISAEQQVTTKDGSQWRVFVECVTKRYPGQTKKTTYAKTSEVKAMRKIIFEVLEKEFNGQDVDKIIKKLSTDAISREIEQRCSSIFNITAIVRKVKPIKNMKIIEASKASSASMNKLETGNEFEIMAEN